MTTRIDMAAAPVVLPPRHQRHFMTLDGLRGIAAIMVVLFHRRWWIDPHFLGRSFLAVDFFFILSGFVIAHAYEERLRTKRMTLRDFAVVRAIRLWPLIILGALLGTTALVAHAIERDWLGGVAKALLALPLAMLLLPAPPQLQPQPFSTNQPSWSLLFEVLANALYAVLAPRLNGRLLAAITVASGGALLAVALGGGRGLGVGWLWPTLLPGIPRVLFPFFLGVMLRRAHAAGRLPAIGVPPWLLALLLIAILAAPVLSDPAETAVELVAVFLLFPAIVALGSVAEPAGRWLPVAAISAELSYPLYVLHLPLLDLLDRPLAALPVSPSWRLAIAAIVVGGLALAVGRLIDAPLRDWLRRRIGSRRAPVAMPVQSVSDGRVSRSTR